MDKRQTTQDTTQGPEKILKGLPISPGIAIGRPFILSGGLPTEIPLYHISVDDIAYEKHRFHKARDKLKQELSNILKNEDLYLSTVEQEILETYNLMIDDHSLITSIEQEIEKSLVNVEQAVHRVATRYKNLFFQMDNELMKERSYEIVDLLKRLMYQLLFVSGSTTINKEPAIIVSDELTPNTTIRLDKSKVLGFVTEKSGITSHAAIIARNLTVPAVSNIKAPAKHLKKADLVIVDGFQGIVIINPTPDTLQTYKKKYAEFEKYKKDLQKIINLPAVTQDNVKIELYANIGSSSDAYLANLYKADGIGLLRTELMYMESEALPSEETLIHQFQQIFRDIKKEIYIRVLDIGGDKYLSYLPIPAEKNPFLGLRGLKFFRLHPDILETQIKAILQASVHSDKEVGIMYPMITNKEDLLFMKNTFEKATESLKKERKNFNPNVKQGIMIEIPSTLFVLEQLLPEVDFISIGTNDLIQYMLAVDRNNELVANYYEPAEPAIIRAIAHIAKEAQKYKIPVSICGELASDPMFTPLFIGLGIQRLSMSPPLIPQVKAKIRNISATKCQRLASEILKCNSANQIKRLLSDFEK